MRFEQQQSAMIFRKNVTVESSRRSLPAAVQNCAHPGQIVRPFRFTIGPTMSFVLQPWQLFFAILAGWVNREQQKRIDYYIRTET